MKTILSACGLVWIFGSIAIGASVPAGFRTETIAEGINAGTALSIAADGRVYYAEQTGHIRIVEDGVVLPRPLLDISARLSVYWESGLIGFQFDPAFPEKPYLFVVYVAKDPHVHHVISRFTVEGDFVDLASERILLEGDDQATLGGSQRGGHQGGPIRFGPDGRLYIAIGEQTEEKASQSLETLQGKILRINRDGSIPEDNPFYERTQGKYRSIYAIGIRNPFGLAFHPGTGRLYEADIGKSSFDEINEILAGRNYGWPLAEGMSDDSEFTNPIHAYPPAIGRSICGSAFYPELGAFPFPWKGKLFFADWASNWVKAIDVDKPEVALDFATEFDKPVALDIAPDGALWVLNRGTRWRDENKFKNNSGSLTRVSYVGGDYSENETVAFSQSLLDAGVLVDSKPFQLSAGFERFEMNNPIWRPGVRVANWLKMPDGGKIVHSSDSDWAFPEGAMIVQHFEDLLGEPHETHLYESNGDGTYKASAYRWSQNVEVAAIVERSEFMPMKSDASIMWLSPGPTARLAPETAIFGFQPQFNARQLNKENQLVEWGARGWLENSLSDREIGKLPKLHPLEDESIPEIERIRSYLDVNCASCHKPGGPSRGFFDARFQTSFKDQNLVSEQLMAGDLGVSGAKLIAPGDPEKSILYLRLARKDGFRMPPGSINAEDPPILPLLEKWIRELGANR